MVRAQRRRQSRVSAHKTTVLPGGISSPTFLFCLCGRRKRPPKQRQREDWRYARLILDIRSQWHHRGAYLYENVEICAADPRCTLSTASSLCISPLESPTVANVEKRCGAPGPSLRLRLRSGRQKASCVQDDREPAASMVTREELLL